MLYSGWVLSGSSHFYSQVDINTTPLTSLVALLQLVAELVLCNTTRGPQGHDMRLTMQIVAELVTRPMVPCRTICDIQCNL